MAARTYEPAQVRSNAERKRGGSFVSLAKEGDQLLGWALFKSDVEAEGNKGYYEYWCHFTPATGFMPCPGSEVCPLCEEGDSPNTRAKTAWLVPKDPDDPDPTDAELKFFEFNWSLINDFASDGASSLGQLYRITKLGGKKGSFSIRTKEGKLNKTQLNAALKTIEDDQLKNMTKKQMNRTLEEMDVEEAMSRDDEDQPQDEKPARRGRPKDEEPEETTSAKSSKTAAKPPADDAFDPETEDTFEGTVTLLRAPTKDNTAQVETTKDGVTFKLFGTDEADLREFSKGDMIEIIAGKDTDDDWVASAVEASEGEQEPAAEESVPPSEGDHESSSAEDLLEDVKATITAINSQGETMTVELENGETIELFFLDEGESKDGKDWSNFDLDDYKEDQVVTVSAHRDEDGDMLSDTFPTKASARGRKTSS